MGPFGHRGGSLEVAFSDSNVAIGDLEGVRFLDLKHCDMTSFRYCAPVSGVQFSPNGRTATALVHSRLTVWDLESRKEIASVDPLADIIAGAATTPLDVNRGYFPWAVDYTPDGTKIVATHRLEGLSHWLLSQIDLSTTPPTIAHRTVSRPPSFWT